MKRRPTHSKALETQLTIYESNLISSSSSTKPFTVNLYHVGVFIVKPFKYTHGDFKVIDDVDFDGLLYVQMYDIMEMIQDQLALKDQLVKTTFKCNADDVGYENLDDLKDIVDFEVEGEENVVITRNTTDDPWLNKLIGIGTFIGQTDDATSNLGGRFNHEENNPEDDIVDPKFKAKPFVRYPSFDPSTPWDQCQPNDHSKLLVYCGRDVSEGKCVFFKGKNPKDKTKDVDCSTNFDKGDTPDNAECSSKPAIKKNGRSSEAMKERQAVLESNSGSTCHLETKDRDDDSKITFKRKYICFKGIKQGLLDAYRKVIGLDGCFLTHTCKGRLLTAIEDLELGYGGGLTLISNGYKGLLKAVAGILLDSEHMKCARPIYANFKRKWGGLQYKRLFWGAASCILDQQFLLKMEQIKELDPTAHKWIYIMQGMCHMNKVSFKLEDTVTSYVRKRLELLKDKQRSWLVYPSGFKEVEVRRGDYAYGVNLHTKQCGCRF
ncbi:hypothetical protein Tco_0744950 [Tanacetum coccineum]